MLNRQDNGEDGKQRTHKERPDSSDFFQRLRTSMFPKTHVLNCYSIYQSYNYETEQK